MKRFENKRDIESEREELLKLINKNVSRKLQAEIYDISSMIPEPELPQITISYEDACNANEG